MVGRDAVKRIEFDHLVQGNEIFDEGRDIIIEFTQIDIDALYDPVQEFFKFFHWRYLLQTDFTFFHGVEDRREHVR